MFCINQLKMGLIYTFTPYGQESQALQQTPQQQIPDDPELRKKIIESNIAFQNSMTRLNETELYIRGLIEIRNALNYPSVKDGDSGLGERPPLQAIFDQDIDAPRLKERYFDLLDRYMRYTKQLSRVMGTELPKEAKQAEQ